MFSYKTTINQSFSHLSTHHHLTHHPALHLSYITFRYPYPILFIHLIIPSSHSLTSYSSIHTFSYHFSSLSYFSLAFHSLSSNIEPPHNSHTIPQITNLLTSIRLPKIKIKQKQKNKNKNKNNNRKNKKQQHYHRQTAKRVWRLQSSPPAKTMTTIYTSNASQTSPDEGIVTCVFVWLFMCFFIIFQSRVCLCVSLDVSFTWSHVYFLVIRKEWSFF